MSKYNNNVIQMLYQYAPDYVSGEFIANQLHISRTTVKKNIDKLKEEGCEIESLNQRGHRLLSLPDKWYQGIVTSVLPEDIYFNHIEVFDTIESTQLVAKQKLVGNQDHFLILSNEQSKGKGRFNRPWDSAKGKGLWMSLVVRPHVSFDMITKFNLFIALGIRDAIQQYSNDEVSVKWPNDIYIGDQKVCGFLSEMVANNDGIEAVICGIGINMNHQADDFDETLQSIATSIRLHADEKINRYSFLATLIEQFDKRYQQFMTQPFSTIKEEYKNATNMWHRKLRFTENGTQFEGQALDIDDSGYLIVENEQTGELKKLMSADIDL
ncbi:biotin--[acetyl-CoA-carboxylase] ligase [Staphylococcus auricularis]|uniref:biotin--[acetyl-CoA-carboxylase] ligase n=1 Tax=Staphylococcus auricularis TaxID=29379 RepID=UPI0012454F39|nr:biotin--[acetyl-CoA-carboxylase] ligase [Staphylococcus auricularis]HJE02237.1 biotin--[acetyl-CoA-carboxylase] ligase [Staphylococcus auricularis]